MEKKVIPMNSMMTISEFTYLLLNVTGYGDTSVAYIINTMDENNLSTVMVMNYSEEEFNQTFNQLGKLSRGKAVYSQFNDFFNVNSIEFERAKAEYQSSNENGIVFITCLDARYPHHIKEKYNNKGYPALLMCAGNVGLLNNNRCVSIIGARDSYSNTLRMTTELTRHLVRSGNFVIVSGGAKGVDMEAHNTVIADRNFTKNASTICILPHGIRIVHPLTQFADDGNVLLVSKFRLNEPFSGTNAMKRNKLVVALSQAVIVMASAPPVDSQGRHSGTFDAAVKALAMGTPTFVPDPTRFSRSMKDVHIEGIMLLIKNGAVSITDPKQITQHLTTKSI